jgi:hypothetical protein
VDADVVLGVARGVEQLELATATEVEPVPVRDAEQPVGGDRRARAVDRVVERSVDLPCRRVEPGRVVQVARPHLAHDDRGVREGRGDVPRAAGVVEVDVGEHQVREVVRVESELGEPPQDVVDGPRRTALDQCRAGRVEQVAGGHRGHPAGHRVDGQDAVVVALDRRRRHLALVRGARVGAHLDAPRLPSHDRNAPRVPGARRPSTGSRRSVLDGAGTGRSVPAGRRGEGRPWWS